MAKIPDKAEHTRQFARLDTSARRDILKSVNRGKAVDDRRLAHLAVGVARRQQKFWKRAWIVGPIVGATSFIGATSVTAAAINAAIATIGLGLMSWFWYSRAARAEEINLTLAVGSKRAGQEHARGGGDPTAGERFRSHLPGQPSSAGGSAGPTSGGLAREGGGPASNGPTAADGTPATPPGQRPYRPRGRKRR